MDANADIHKLKGNTHFANGNLEAAIQEYSIAIIKNPSNPVFYTNRALCHLKLKHHDRCIMDCQKATELDEKSVKGYYLLGQCLLESNQRLNEACTRLQKAYSLAIEQKVNYVDQVHAALRKAKARRWEKEDQRRRENDSDLYRYLQELIECDRTRQLQDSDHESRDSVNSTLDDRLSQIHALFEQANENAKKREVPDYFLSKISLEVMTDPVITTSGITYDKTEILSHLSKIGPWDPISRKALNERDLIPNLALKEAIDDFLEKNDAYQYIVCVVTFVISFEMESQLFSIRSGKQMPLISTAKLASLQSNEKNIRNICILAHVDHGKTTLSDSLLASNGIISSKLAGKVRYLDSREDEQERGITMKSSGISLYFKIIKSLGGSNEPERSEEYLINLIDSPGHVDFSSEVSTASRLCDGGLVLVDVVEGVCTQTHAVLRQAFFEDVRPILVFNKIDRLISELQLTPHEAYVHMNQILEQVNAIMATFHTEQLMASDAKQYEERMKRLEINDKTGKDEDNADWQLEDRDDSHLYFSPEQGNVIFASAVDGWAFRIDHFAQLYASKLGISEKALKKVMWGDFYFDPKTKRALKASGVKGRPLKLFFVQFILDNLWAVYNAVYNERDKLEKIITALNLKVLPRELKSKDVKSVIYTIMSQWLPLSSAVLLSVIEVLPSPSLSQLVRVPKLLNLSEDNSIISVDEERTKDLAQSISRCDPKSSLTVAYISKVFSVPSDMLPQNKRVPLTAEEMRERRRLAILKQKEQPQDGGMTEILIAGEATDTVAEGSKEPETNAESLIGFARIYSGTIKVGQTLNILGPKYDPNKPNADRHVTSIQVQKLYLLMGRELEELEEVPAGNVFGIGGLEGKVLKTATLSSTLDCPSFGLVKQEAPILRVALEPENPSEMSKLVDGLRLLNQADPCVEVVLQETGEHVIITAGELHLERCLKDLRERYAKIEISVSPPIVPYRESLSNTPAIVQGELEEKATKETPSSDSDAGEAASSANVPLPTGTVVLNTSNKLATLQIRAVPIPANVVDYIQSHASNLKQIVEGTQAKARDGQLDARLKEMKDTFMSQLEKSFKEAKKEGWLVERDLWEKISVDQIIAFGPKEIGPNLLVNCVSDLAPIDGQSIPADVTEQDLLVQKAKNVKDYLNAIQAGFQLSTSSGPLCNEPMSGVAFFVEDFKLNITAETDDKQVLLLSGQVIAMMREGCRQAFLKWSPRLSLAMYTCELQAPSEVLGKVYSPGYQSWRVSVLQMVRLIIEVSALRKANTIVDLRKKTAGAASPQLIFSGFEVLDLDPFWVPTTEEELDLLGEKGDRENIAKKYMDKVRKRKARLMEEMCILVDNDDRAIGAETKKNCHLMTKINEGLLHRAFSVFLFNSEGKLLLQQRADEKITFPGYLTNTCCSHPLSVPDELEEAEQIGARRAAQRKLEHELGIRPEQVPLDKFKFLTRIHYLAPSDGLWGEHEIDYIFIVQADVDLDINLNEVKSVRYVSKHEMEQLFSNPESEGVVFTPWFKLIAENFLFTWWGQLDRLDDLREQKMIHRL
ncbi:Cytoplasmic GTPase/eEF2-like protein (ribosomal biogenesis) [Chytridiales sp. JEL 0842]|nr:Cytoplasmic GTPase/eEF2-like protein (ribosomal biogenesis) [Chytridiales sp. JEL 0842]